MFSYLNAVALQHMEGVRLKNVGWHEIVFKCEAVNHVCFNLSYSYLKISLSNLLVICKCCLWSSNRDPVLLGGCWGGCWSWSQGECCHPPCACTCDFLTIAVAASSAGTLSALCLSLFSNKSTDRFADWSKPGSMQRTCKADLGTLSVVSNGLHLSAKQ